MIAILLDYYLLFCFPAKNQIIENTVKWIYFQIYLIYESITEIAFYSLLHTNDTEVEAIVEIFSSLDEKKERKSLSVRIEDVKWRLNNKFCFENVKHND